jgi:hypothetical protein
VTRERTPSTTSRGGTVAREWLEGRCSVPPPQTRGAAYSLLLSRPAPTRAYVPGASPTSFEHKVRTAVSDCRRSQKELKIKWTKKDRLSKQVPVHLPRPPFQSDGSGCSHKHTTLWASQRTRAAAHRLAARVEEKRIPQPPLAIGSRRTELVTHPKTPYKKD